ncbi:Metallo-dependent phosphatase-like protein [Xylariaceae sp. FL0016]|nr:Metallo-dependent phosphatase-like protein [Xylariaceae sp. FL0016]
MSKEPGKPEPCPSPPRVQILSDLHLELCQQYLTYEFPATAPLLLLAGDVGRLLDYDALLAFFSVQVSRYEKVLWVLGNHEFYGLDYESTVSRASQLAQEEKLAGRLELLQRKRWDDPNSRLTVLGCTLWSYVTGKEVEAVVGRVKDFKRIANWSIAGHNGAHVEDLVWLREQAAQIRAQKHSERRVVLIATHHAPCHDGTSRPEHRQNPWNAAFATDLLDSGDWTGVRVWVFGHTHHCVDFERDGLRVVANQRGYIIPDSQQQGPEESGTKRAGFDPALSITLA